MLRVPWKSASAEAIPASETPVDAVPRGRPRFVRWLVAALVLVVLGAAGYFVYRQLNPAQTAAPAVQTFATRKGNIISTVAATGTVANQNQSRMSFPSTGTSGGSSVVTGLKVNVGDSVTKGQVLATLDSANLQLAVTQAQATLASAQSKLTTIQAGPLPSDVASAQAAVANAQANLDSVKAGASSADLSAAQQSVASANSQVASARSSLAKLKAGPTAQDVRNAQLQINQAKNNLTNAQINQNSICGNAKSTADQCKQAKLSTTNAGYAVTTARNNLSKLYIPATAADLAAAKASVTAAENNYNGAVAKLNDLKAGPTAVQLAAAQSQLAQAQASLVKAQNPYTDADVQSAQATVAQAQAGLDTAKANLDSATLKAPFDGIISAVAINVGEAPASPAITIVDPNALLLNASVDESDIAKLQTGQNVAITFDSLPNQPFQGKVTSIAPNATIQSGVALYPVQVTIANPKGLKAGMTGNANVVYGNAQNVLLVPNTAVKTQGRNKVVQVIADGKQVARPITAGVANDQFTEITDGLAEGDEVVVTGTTTSASRVPGAGGFVGGPGGGLGGGFAVGR